jgi:creatinine amidohydrolase
MRFEQLNWMDIQSYLEHDDRAIIVLGACEQHAYLSLSSDVNVPLALADAASQQSQVLVAPPLNFGCSAYFEAYPGTISLHVETLLAEVRDVLTSLYRVGFRRLLLLNGHGGNELVKGKLYELVNEMPGLNLRWYAWWLSDTVTRIAERHNLKPAHANWLEAFEFNQVAELPVAEKPKPVAISIVDAVKFKEIFGDGSFGGAYQAEVAVMDEMFGACLADILDLLKF